MILKICLLHFGGNDVGCNQAILARSADKVIHKRLEDQKLSAYSFQVLSWKPSNGIEEEGTRWIPYDTQLGSD